MIPLSHLWLAIIGSAVAVFVVSSLLHMLFTYHNSDYKPFSNEDDVRAAINKGGAGAGMYVLPYCPDMKGMREPAMIKKMTEGPTGFVLLRAPGAPKMGPSLTQWFGLTLALSFLAAYVASRAPDRECRGVSRLRWRAGPELDLEGRAVGFDVQEHHRRSDL